MKISDIKTTVVSVPTPGIGHVPSGMHKKPSVKTVILTEVSTDEGLTGLGEAMVVVGPEVTKTIIDSAKPAVVGRDPLSLQVLMKELYGRFNLAHFSPQAGNWALIGIEMALWDIVGKCCGQPLHNLWGGAFRTQIPYRGDVAFTDPEDMAEQAKGLVSRGFMTLGFKVGFGDDEDVEAVRAVREAVGPDVEIRVDANQSWMPGEAIRVINKMAKYDLQYVEQPVSMHNLDAMVRVRESVSVPIASHESSWTFYRVLDLVKANAADVIYVDPRFDAGFAGARKTAAIAEAASIPLVAHGYQQLGVSTAAIMHLIAACPGFIYANQGGYPGLADDILKGGKMKFTGECLRLPDAPGIGVELDPDKVAQYAAYYDRNIKGRHVETESRTLEYMLMLERRYLGY
jgi:L-alanine-DL-glutamate epimerase-like enolase superfamily enzyme